MGNAPSTESENRRRADEAAATQAVSQPAHAIAEIEAAKNATQNSIVDKATREVRQMFEDLFGAQTHVKAGFAAEFHHEAAFNVDAVEKGSMLRCLVVDSNSNSKAADLKIFDLRKPHVTLQEVQVKTGSRHYVNKSLNHAKYEGMQKVVSEGLENPNKGLDSRVKLGGASSTPLSQDGAYDMVEDPKKHFDGMRPDVAQDALKCGLTGAAIGGAAGAVISTAATLAR